MSQFLEHHSLLEFVYAMLINTQIVDLLAVGAKSLRGANTLSEG